MRTKEIMMRLINPFKQIAGWKAMFVGLLVVILTAFLGQKNNVIFNGVLDIHDVKHSLTEAFIVQGISLLCLVFTMFILGKLGSKSKIRFIDVAGTMTLSRFPFLLAAIIGFIPAIHVDPREVMNLVTTMNFLPSVMVPLLLFTLVCIFILIWFIALAYNAFSVSCNIKGVKNILLFIIGIIISEILALTSNYFIMKYYITAAIMATTVANTTGQFEASAQNDYSSINKIAIESAEFLKSNDYEKVVAYFDDAMRAALPESKLKETMEQLNKQVGRLQSVDSTVRNTEKDSFRIVLVPCQFEKGKFNLQFTFNKTNQICGFYIR